MGSFRYRKVVTYQVFARKYRPQIFDDVLGQDHVVQTLKNAITQRRLAHAYLFVGPRGTGKTSTARILAKALNCVHGPTVTPCGVCDSCREISQGNSLDVLEIDGASNNSVDQVRELRENVRFVPVRGRYKVYIIDEVHMLTQQAFNALLKTLEEPPEHVIFVFATTEVHRVLPTILSRCQRFDLRRIPTKVIARHLGFIAEQEKVVLAPEAAEAIAVAADGGLRDAESMLDQLVAFCGDRVGESEVLEVFGLTSERVVIDLFRAIIHRKAAEALALIDRQAEAGKDLGKLLTDLLVFARHLLVYQVDAATLREEVSDAVRAALDDLRPQLTTPELLRLIQQLADTEAILKWSSNKRMHLEIGAIRAVQGLEEVGLDAVLTALEELRSGAGSPGSRLTPPAKAVRPSPVTAPLESPAPLQVTPPEISPAPASKPAPERAAKPDLSAGRPSEAGTEPAPAVDPETRKPAAEAHSEAPVEQVPASQEAVSVPSESPKDSLLEFWAKLLDEVRRRRPLILSWLEKAAPVSTEGGVLRIGFPPGQNLALESLMRANNRKFVEGLVSERLGSAYRVEGEIKEGLEPVALGAPGAEVDANEAFKRDPLIQKALEIFRAEIQVGDGL
ncbi:MAG TPA: DNA polymerase III subunit gamma/tau [Chthoniobacterales bacterium]